MSETQSKIFAPKLAARFYDEHQTQFAQAAMENGSFRLTAQEFDSWLLDVGSLDAVADDFDSSAIERAGVVQRRNTLRMKINRAAKKAETHPAYVIDALHSRAGMRVRLLALYATEAPREIARRIETSTRHYVRLITADANLVKKSPHVTEEGRAAIEMFARIALPMLTGIANGFAATIVSKLRKAEQRRSSRREK